MSAPSEPGPITAAELAEVQVDLPLVNEDLEAASVPLVERLRSRRVLLSIVLPIGILVLLLAALPGFDLAALPRYIGAAEPAWLLAALGIYFLGFPLRGYRWALLVRGAGYPLRVTDSTEILLISWMVNCLVPAKLGDVYRAYLLRINTGVAFGATFGTVFMERAFDLIAVVILGLAAGFWSFRTDMPPEVRLLVGFGIVIAVVLSVGLLVVRNFGRRIIERLPVHRRVVAFYDVFEAGMFAIDRRQTPVFIGLTVLIWLTEALRLWCVIAALGFSYPTLDFAGVAFVALIASLLTAVPFTPAGLGLVESGMVFMLTRIYHVPGTEAAAISIVDRAISVLSVIAIGSVVYVFSSKKHGTTGRVAAPASGSGPSTA